MKLAQLPKVSFIISGYGSNLIEVLKKLRQDKQKNFLPLNIISNNFISNELKTESKKNIYKIKLYEKVNNLNSINFLETSLIFSIGYMKKIPTKIINQYKTINLHPSLLPLYKGSMTYKRMIINNEKELGFTIHKVNKFIDEGRILYQKNSLIKNNDELKVINFNKTLEHKYVYVALKKICNNLDKL